MLADRHQLEAEERERLASYALMSGDSAGRVYPQEEAQYRTAFQRDRDRVLHSAAFRRLEYKTQVFVFDEGDYYRTRLTHTLEVAQIARTIARALRVNEDLVEAICLAHDLGHPPFGHAGEAALDMLTSEYGGFNHNYQSYRVVTELEERYPAWPGLNLTYETRVGLAKHATTVNVSDLAGFDTGLRGSLEAQIADVTDALAYSAHDLDDGLLAGLIAPEDLTSLDIWRLICDQAEWRGGRLDEVSRHILIRELVGVLVSDVIETTAGNLDKLASQMPLAIQSHDVDLVSYSVTMDRMRLALREFLYERMYFHYRVVRMQQRAHRFIGEIFEALVKSPKQLPHECQKTLEARGLYRTVADYIASMTDRSALLEYRRLFDPETRP